VKAENQTGASISLSFDKTKLQFSVIHEFLTTSYWSPGMSEEVVRKALSNSLTVGAYRSGFERIVDPTSLMQIVRPNIYQRQG